MGRSLADMMKTVDAKIYAAIGELAHIGSTNVPGIFSKKYLEVQLENGTVAGLAISFSCQYDDVVAALTAGTNIDVLNQDGVVMGTYKFIRHVPPGGEESGRVHLELGTL
jgi:GrpB-like predicted nucleotidyltransferase (UPF0157 family)